jgi:signal recognition particle receptor subunit beta
MNFKDNINEAANVLKNIQSICGNELNYPESIDDLSKPVKFAVFGSYSVGKSTFINSFVFKGRILPAGIGETTKKTVLFSYSQGSQNLFNEQPFEFKELENFLLNSTKQLNEVYINNSNLKDYTVVDVPGYGGILENDLEEIIKKGCEEANAVFFLFDISKGLSGNDKEKSESFISHFLKADSKTQIWIIFNRLDAEEDKTEQQICNLIAETLCSLKMISENEKKELDSYEKLAEKKAFALSAKKSLDGYCGSEIKGGIEKSLSKEKADEILEESRMLFFREKFVSSLEQTRIETFIFKLNQNIDYICNELTTYEEYLEKKIEEKNQLEQTMTHKVGIKDREIDFIFSTKQKIADDLIQVEKFLDNLNNSQRKNEIEQLKKALLGIYEECLIKSISKYQLVGGPTKEELIEEGIANANKESKPILEKFVEVLILEFVKSHSSLQNHIIAFNEKNPEDMLIVLKNINNLTNIPEKGEFSNLSNTMFNEIAIEIAGVISSIVAGSIMLFFETRLATLLIPGIGWALAGVGLIYSIWSTATIGETIAKKVKPELEKSLYRGEFPEKLTNMLYNQIIENHKIKASNVIDVSKDNIKILSRLSANNEDEKKSIENEMQQSLIERNLDISNRESKISNIKSNVENLKNICKIIY